MIPEEMLAKGLDWTYKAFEPEEVEVDAETAVQSVG